MEVYIIHLEFLCYVIVYASNSMINIDMHHLQIKMIRYPLAAGRQSVCENDRTQRPSVRAPIATSVEAAQQYIINT